MAMMQMPSADAWFRASARGCGVGVTVLNDGEGHALVIHVLPKLWRGSRSVRYVTVPAEADTVDLYEGDYLGLPDPWAELLMGVAPGLASDVGNDPLWDRVLLPASTPPAKGQVRPGYRLPMWDLLLSHGMAPVDVAGHRADFVAAGTVLAQEDALRPLYQSLFIDRVAELLRFRRPRYRTVRESLSVVRGRMVPAALLRRAAGGGTVVECEYETLTTDTAFWRTVRTALESCTSVVGRDWELTGALRQLEDVGYEPPAVALAGARQTAQQLRGEEQRDVFSLALDILRAEYSPAVDRSQGRGVMVNLKFDTSVLWEKMLAQAFRDAGATVTEQDALYLFYREDGRAGTPKRPDLIIEFRNRDGEEVSMILDAKYKWGTTLTGATKDDQSQIAVYALRSGLPAFLVSARSGEGASNALTVRRIPSSALAWGEDRATPAELENATVVGSFQLPFPHPEDDGNCLSLCDHARDVLTSAAGRLR